MPCPSKAFMSLVAAALMFLVTATASLSAEAVPAKVEGVSDGDTLKAVIDGKETKIRLYGIDAPEKAQPFGQVSTDAIKQLTTGHKITIQAIDRDRYGRTVAIVFADGANVNEALVKSGNAWVYQQYCTQPFCSEWDQYQQAAKDARSGLWKDEDPVAPWEWRHGGASAKKVEKQDEQADISDGVIGNVSTRKFHSSDCRYADCKKCTANFTTREKAIAAGFVPCKVCNP